MHVCTSSSTSFQMKTLRFDMLLAKLGISEHLQCNPVIPDKTFVLPQDGSHSCVLQLFIIAIFYCIFPNSVQTLSYVSY